jgi:hypothetical protein
VEQLAIGAASDAGRVRPKNEDYVLWEFPEDPDLRGGRDSGLAGRGGAAALTRPGAGRFGGATGRVSA